MRPVFVDLDGTLLRRRGSERRFLLQLLRRGLIGPRQLAAGLAFLLAQAPRHGRRAIKLDKAYLWGLDETELSRLGRRFAEERLRADLCPALLARLAAHRAEGERPVLLTGSLAYLAVPLAESLDADCIATLWRAAGRPPRAALPQCHPYGTTKLTLAGAWAAGAGVPLSACAAYADSIADLPLLRAVGRPVAVRPDRHLSRHARRAGWEILATSGPAATAAAATATPQRRRAGRLPEPPAS